MSSSGECSDLERQLAEQNRAWRAVCDALERLDPMLEFALPSERLQEFEAAIAVGARAAHALRSGCTLVRA